MNDYKITYTGESEGFRIITDRTEAAAKKFFREEAKEMDLGRITIESVELVSTNALATKRNERETLEVIRQMVADLGPQSYLATAFEGCFEIAEQTIEFDFADSMKGRLESAEKKLQDEKDAHEATKKSLESKLRAAQVGIDELIQKDDERKAAMEKIAARTHSADDLEDFHQLLDDRIAESEESAEKAAQEIVKYAEDPTRKEFGQAVTDHRNYTKRAEYYRDLISSSWRKCVCIECSPGGGLLTVPRWHP